MKYAADMDTGGVGEKWTAHVIDVEEERDSQRTPTKPRGRA